MFNRTIWFLWLQGLSSAPDIIKMCLHSWRRENPDWNVVVLDETNLDQYTDIPLDAEIKSRLLPNWYANLIRLDLLNKHGGVWVDATCYCIQPLDLWLTPNLHAHLFMFQNRGDDRAFGSWFIASHRDNYLLQATYKALIQYWSENNFKDLKSYSQTRTYKLMQRLFNTNTHSTRYWFNPIVTKIFKYAPYFNFHYQMNRLIENDQEAKSIADQILRYSNIGWKYRHASFKNSFKPMSVEVRNMIDSQQIPLLKLTWKNHARRQADCVYDYLEKNYQTERETNKLLVG